MFLFFYDLVSLVQQLPESVPPAVAHLLSMTQEPFTSFWTQVPGVGFKPMTFCVSYQSAS